MISTVALLISFATLPKDDLFQCHLKFIHDNTSTEKKNYVCVFSCKDSRTKFEWYETKKDRKGCKINKKFYKM